MPWAGRGGGVVRGGVSLQFEVQTRQTLAHGLEENLCGLSDNLQAAILRSLLNARCLFGSMQLQVRLTQAALAAASLQPMADTACTPHQRQRSMLQACP